MNQPEQKEPEQKEPEQKEPEQKEPEQIGGGEEKNQVPSPIQNFHNFTQNLTVDWDYRPHPGCCNGLNHSCRRRFAENQELLSINFDTIKKITKLRDENTKIEELIKKYLIKFDKKREEFTKEQEDQKEQYEDCNRRLDMRVAAIENAIRDCSEDKMISLNIGGQVFLTLKSTVSNISPFFANLFSDDWGDAKRKTIRDKDGNIFIDRSPLYFQYILDWSRNGADPQELIDIVQAISGPNWTDQTGLSSKLSLKTFMKTLEYYGVDHEFCHIDPELAVGNELDIYWRGDKCTYKGTIKKLQFDKEEQDFIIIIKYEDNHTWKYTVKQLNKIHGPYSNIESHRKSKNTKWWHYGEDKGGIKISSNESSNPTPSRRVLFPAGTATPTVTTLG